MPDSIEPPKIFSTHEVAQLLGVDMTTVIGWCKQGKIQAYKTPGKHRRIKENDLLQFLRKFQMPIPSALGQNNQLKCVVVDDETTIRNLIKRVIKDMNPTAQIAEAGDGFEAGQKINELRPHIVVLDLNLPGMDGFKVCKIIKNTAGLEETKILAISGFDTAETHKRILDAGADVFLPKPFTPQIIKEKMLLLMKGNSVAGAMASK